MPSMFAKRHYESLAQLMQDTKPADDTGTAAETWCDIRDEMTVMFRRDNHLFQNDRFIRACVPGANVRARTK